MLRGQGDFDIELEVDLFAAQLAAQLRASRHQQLLFCDKTIMNVAAYARLVVTTDVSGAKVLDAIDAFCAAWAHTYDLVLFCADNYAPADDAFRALVAGIQDPVAAGVRAACQAAGAPLTELPPGLDVGGRVAAAAAHIDSLLERGS